MSTLRFLVIGFLLLSTSAAQGDTCFVLRLPDLAYISYSPSFPATDARAVAVGDFDGDGLDDLVFSDDAQGVITVLLRRGEWWASPIERPRDETPRDLVVGDYNHDGNLDVAYLTLGVDSITVHYGDGAGNLGPENTLVTSVDPLGLVAADFDGDGLTDFAHYEKFAPIVWIYLGSPVGYFGVQYLLPDEACDISVLDFDNDGDLDLAVTHESGVNSGIAPIENLGTGFFGVLTSVPTFWEAGEVVSGDFDGDGWTDLLVARDNDTWRTYLGDGVGGFAFATEIQLSDSTWDLSVEDFDADGVLDVAARLGGNDYDVIVVGYGDGLGGFDVTTLQPRPDQKITQIAAGDFDGDGAGDLVIAGRVCFFLESAALTPDCDGSGAPDLCEIQAGTSTDLDLDDLPDACEIAAGAADCDADGVIDATLNTLFQTVDVTPLDEEPWQLFSGNFDLDPTPDLLAIESVAYFIDGASGLTSVETWTGGWTGDEYAVGDLDNDGITDVVRNTSGSLIEILLGVGDFTFSTQVVDLGDPLAWIDVVDVNGDGGLDLLVHRDLELTVHLNDGTATFGPAIVSPLTLSSRWAQPLDLENDGAIDLIVENFDNYGYSTLRGDGTGLFSVGDHFPDYPGPIATGDVNGDGTSDLVYSRLFQPGRIHYGDGSGGFAPPVELPFSHSRSELADLDGDGALDLIGFPGPVVHRGVGGSFADEGEHYRGAYGGPGRVLDVDLDGHLDVVSRTDVYAPASPAGIATWKGVGDGTFRAPRSYPGPSNEDSGFSGSLGDFNGDDRLDAVVHNGTDGSIATFVTLPDATMDLIDQDLGPLGMASSATGDVNGDGHVDLVIAIDDAVGSLRIYLGNGSGQLAYASTLMTAAVPVAVVVTDVNADGIPDLLSSSTGDDSLEILLGVGALGFSTAQLIDTDTGYYIWVGDIVDTPSVDLVIAQYFEDRLEILAGDGTGQFWSHSSMHASRPRAIVSGDVDGDGAIDLVVSADDVTVFREVEVDLWGLGEASETLTSFVTALAVEDLDGDGTDEIVSSGLTYPNMSLTRVVERGLRTRIIPEFAQLNRLGFSDVNGDGSLDLVGRDSGGFVALSAYRDCNANGVLDTCDIDSGFSQDANSDGIPDECGLPRFVRGDCNGDGALVLSDVIFMLDGIFGGASLPCRLACDANDDGALDVSDPVYELGYLFLSADPPSAPHPDCGEDPTADFLTCDVFIPCP